MPIGKETYIIVHQTMSALQFARYWPRERYILEQFRHVLPVVNGIIYDIVEPPTDARL